MESDFLLKGGHLIDPKNSIDGLMDLTIEDGKIAAIGSNIPVDQAKQIIDINGLYVTPGLIDIHAHMYATPGNRNAWAGDQSILPDGFSFRAGVTTMVDTGSAGWRNFEDFRYRIIDRFHTRIFAFINIVGMGMNTTVVEQNIHDMDPKITSDVAREHEEVVVGIKTAHFTGPEWISVDNTLKAGENTNLPAMIDFGYFCNERPYYQLVTEKLRSGDISTHMYHGAIPYVDAEGNLLDYLFKSRALNVIFDVGHGGGSFLFRNAVPSIRQGFYPDSISTDLHTGSMNGAMIDMTTVMSKFLAIGMPLTDIIRASTTTPANIIGHPELGHLTVGAVADLAVLNKISGRFNYMDVAGGSVQGNHRLICEMTFKDGQIVWDWNARMGLDYRQLGSTYGLRDVDSLIMPES